MVVINAKDIDGGFLFYLQNFILAFIINIFSNSFVIAFLTFVGITALSYVPKLGLIIRILFVLIYMLIGYFIGQMDSTLMGVLSAIVGLIIGAFFNLLELAD